MDQVSAMPMLREIHKNQPFFKTDGHLPDVPGVEEDVLNRSSKLDLINDKTSGCGIWTRHLQEAAKTEQKNVERNARCWYQKNRKDTLDGIRYGLLFTNKQESLGNRWQGHCIRKMRQNIPTESPTVEKYARCPFSIHNMD